MKGHLCMDKPIFKRYGFTLIEILIVVSLFSLISIAIYSSVVSGLNVWNRIRTKIIEEDIALFFDKISLDLHNSYFYSKIKPEGSRHSISFPCRVWVPADSKLGLPSGHYLRQLGKVEYFFDKEKHLLIKKIANYSQALKGDYGFTKILLDNIVDVYFRYFYFRDNKEIETYTIENGSLPFRVKIYVVVSLPCGEKRTISRYVDVPLGVL